MQYKPLLNLVTATRTATRTAASSHECQMQQLADGCCRTCGHHGPGMQHLQYLCCFGARRCTHVQNLHKDDQNVSQEQKSLLPPTTSMMLLSQSNADACLRGTGSCEEQAMRYISHMCFAMASRTKADSCSLSIGCTVQRYCWKVWVVLKSSCSSAETCMCFLSQQHSRTTTSLWQ